MLYGSWLGWQIDYLLWLQNFRDVSHHAFDKFFIYITMFGEITIPIMLICFIYWVINKKAGQFMFFSWMCGFITNLLLKSIGCIYRPWILDSRIHPVPEAIPAATGYSFPSGHTAGVMDTFGALAVWFWNNKFLRYLCIVIILCVMFSRNYLGVHTPQDVIVSFVVCCLVLWGVYTSLKWVDEGQEDTRDIVFASGMILLALLTTVFMLYKPYPVHYLFGKVLYSPMDMIHHSIMRSGVLYGGLLGWIIERRYIDFQPAVGTVLKKIIRFVLGAVCLTALSGSIKMFLAGALPCQHICAFIQYFITGCFITCIYPFMIKKFNI